MEKNPKVEKSLITLSLTSLIPSSNGIIFQINDSQVVALLMNLQYKISSHVAHNQHLSEEWLAPSTFQYSFPMWKISNSYLRHHYHSIWNQCFPLVCFLKQNRLFSRSTCHMTSTAICGVHNTTCWSI